jgi:hypothetical protein
MSKFFRCAIASGLLLAGSVSAFAEDGFYAAQNGNSVAQSGSLWRPAAPPVQPSQQPANNARRFYSYQPAAVRGDRARVQPFVRPASAKALGNY